MKKALILLGLAIILALSGCSKNKITCTIISPKNGAEHPINDDLVITVEATDTKGIIARVTVHFNNASYSTTGTNPYTATVPSEFLTPGKQTIRAVAIDKENMQAESSISITITEKFVPAELPEVTTNAVINITATYAIAEGNVTHDGNRPISARGVCWSTVENPTIENSKTEDDIGAGSFSSIISDIAPNTLYYVRAYATNEVGTAYGEQVSFTTLSFHVPTVATGKIPANTSTSVLCGGNVTSDGYNLVTARGVCWSTSKNPTINGSKTIDGSGTGSFTSNITGLNKGTLYYVRAYATNEAGTVYGNQVSFTVDAGVEINGVLWATYNVDMPGTFAEKPEDAGMFYQWARKIGWSTTDPLINSNGGTTWDIFGGSGIIWLKANDPCPTGWRVPTIAELQSLAIVDSQWATVNGINGCILGNGNNTIFLPVAGYRSYATSVLNAVGMFGYYWSNAADGSSSIYLFLSGNYGNGVGYADRGDAFSVRCVAE